MIYLSKKELTNNFGGDNPFRVFGAYYRGFMNGLFNTDTPISCDSENNCNVDF